MLGSNKGIAMNIAGNRRALRTGALALAVGLVLLAGCKREADTAVAPATDTTAAQPDATAPQAAVEAPLELRDVIENTPQAVVGISYPQDVNRFPGLAKALSDYATAARAELQQAVDGLGNDKPTMPYELSLSFEKVLETPQLVVISADGSRYTGGAHGEPLVARFVWLPETQSMLTADKMIADTKGWGVVSDYIADQLKERVATRLSSEDMDPGQLQESLRSASRMIADGTGASAENFSQFQPMTDPNGLITAVRFVFPPYQVGPYSDGTQTVDVPAAVLAPHVAPAYAALFAKG
ncbi:hypothetical protein QE424_001368 [Stenotrophomonas rhizophila]|uniref:DUF3298 domain-containing protein n=2 Tax=Stenotrophomonas rhizophila TaxID=216778 RepID=A0AAP5AG95_9GAMM|nr:hypothetical protein [Stenotrophomonas rhizophila]